MSIKKEDLKVGAKFLSPGYAKIELTYAGNDLVVFKEVSLDKEFCVSISYACKAWEKPLPKRVTRKAWVHKNGYIREESFFYSEGWEPGLAQTRGWKLVEVTFDEPQE